MSVASLTRLGPASLLFRFPAPCRVSPELYRTDRWAVEADGAPLEVLAVGVHESARVVGSVVLWLRWPPFKAILTADPDLSGLVRDDTGGSYTDPGEMRADGAVGGAGSLRRYRWLEIQGIPEGYPIGYPVPWSPDGGADPGRDSRSAPRVTIPGEYFADGGISALGAKLDLVKGRTASVETLTVKLADLDGRLVKLFQTEEPDTEMTLATRLQKHEASSTGATLLVRYGGDSSGAFDTSGGAVFAFCGPSTLLLDNRSTVDATTYTYDIDTGQAGTARPQLTDGLPVTSSPGFFDGRLCRLWEVDLALSNTPKCLFAGVMDEPQSENLTTWEVRVQDMSRVWNKATFAERLATMRFTNSMDRTTPLDTYILAREYYGPGTTDADPKTATNNDLFRATQSRGWDDLPNADCETSRGYQPGADGFSAGYVLAPTGPRRYALLAGDQEINVGFSQTGGIRRDVGLFEDDMLTALTTDDEVENPLSDEGDPLSWLGAGQLQPSDTPGGIKSEPGTVLEVLRLDNRGWPQIVGSTANFAECLLRILTSTGLGTNGDFDTLPDTHGLGIAEQDIDIASFTDRRTGDPLAFGFVRPSESGGLFDLLAERVALPSGHWLIHTRDGRVLLRRLADLLEHEDPEWQLGRDVILYDPHPTLRSEPVEAYEAVSWDYEDVWLECGDVRRPPTVLAPEGYGRMAESRALKLKSPMIRYYEPANSPAPWEIGQGESGYVGTAMRILALLGQASELYDIALPAIGEDGTDYRDIDLGDVVQLNDVPVATRRGVRSMTVRALVLGAKYDISKERVELTLSNAIGQRLRRRGFSFSGRIYGVDTRYVWVSRDELHTEASQALEIPIGLAVGDDVRCRWGGCSTSPGGSTTAELLACEAVSTPNRWRLDFGVAGVPSSWFHALVSGSTSGTLKVAGDQSIAGNGRFYVGQTLRSNDPQANAGGHVVQSASFDGTNTNIVISPSFGGAPTAGSWLWPADACIIQPDYGDASTAARKFAHFAAGSWLSDGDGYIWIRPPLRPTVDGDPLAVTAFS